MSNSNTTAYKAHKAAADEHKACADHHSKAAACHHDGKPEDAKASADHAMSCCNAASKKSATACGC